MYIPEIEQGYEHPCPCEQVLANIYEILEVVVRGNYRFSRKVYEFASNDLVKLTKRLLLGADTAGEMPS
jgi:hypothetical protein